MIKKSIIGFLKFFLAEDGKALKIKYGISLFYVLFFGAMLFSKSYLPTVTKYEHCIKDVGSRHCIKMQSLIGQDIRCTNDASKKSCGCISLIQPLGTIARNTIAVLPAFVPLVIHKFSPLYSVNYAISLFTTSASLMLIKDNIKEMRPDGSNDKSFASAHTGLSFVGSVFIFANYNKVIGSMLMVISAMTSYSRIYCHKHFFHNLVIGFLIAVFNVLYLNKILIASARWSLRKMDNAN